MDALFNFPSLVALASGSSAARASASPAAPESGFLDALSTVAKSRGETGRRDEVDRDSARRRDDRAPEESSAAATALYAPPLAIVAMIVPSPPQDAQGTPSSGAGDDQRAATPNGERVDATLDRSVAPATPRDASPLSLSPQLTPGPLAFPAPATATTLAPEPLAGSPASLARQVGATTETRAALLERGDAAGSNRPETASAGAAEPRAAASLAGVPIVTSEPVKPPVVRPPVAKPPAPKPSAPEPPAPPPPAPNLRAMSFAFLLEPSLALNRAERLTPRVAPPTTSQAVPPASPQASPLADDAAPHGSTPPAQETPQRVVANAPTPLRQPTPSSDSPHDDRLPARDPMQGEAARAAAPAPRNVSVDDAAPSRQRGAIPTAQVDLSPKAADAAPTPPLDQAKPHDVRQAPQTPALSQTKDDAPMRSVLAEAQDAPSPRAILPQTKELAPTRSVLAEAKDAPSPRAILPQTKEDAPPRVAAPTAGDRARQARVAGAFDAPDRQAGASQAAQRSPDAPRDIGAARSRDADAAPLETSLPAAPREEKSAPPAGVVRIDAAQFATRFADFLRDARIAESARPAPLQRGVPTQLAPPPPRVMTIALEPASLGWVRVRLHFVGGTLRLDISTQTPEAAALVEATKHSLASTMRAIGEPGAPPPIVAASDEKARSGDPAPPAREDFSGAPRHDAPHRAEPGLERGSEFAGPSGESAADFGAGRSHGQKSQRRAPEPPRRDSPAEDRRPDRVAGLYL